jgi:hypothetical protein
MFWYLVDILALRRLGLSRPLRYLLIVIFLGCLVAGLIYASVVFHAIEGRNSGHHVQPYSSH